MHDKTGLVELGRRLAAKGDELISTGGTAAALRAGDVPVVEVGDLTGAPEILDGRVKTLHPGVHGGILARRDDPAHLATLAEHGLAPIDLVVVNLYPFEATIASDADCRLHRADRRRRPGHDPCRRQEPRRRRRGGRAADYEILLAAVEAGGMEAALRRRLAAKAFARTAAYDGIIAGWFVREIGEEFPSGSYCPARAAAYCATARTRISAPPSTPPAANPWGWPARQLQGKELSNNLNDTDTALAIVADFAEPAVAIIKHANLRRGRRR